MKARGKFHYAISHGPDKILFVFGVTHIQWAELTRAEALKLANSLIKSNVDPKIKNKTSLCFK